MFLTPEVGKDHKISSGLLVYHVEKQCVQTMRIESPIHEKSFWMLCNAQTHIKRLFMDLVSNLPLLYNGTKVKQT